MQKGDSMQFTLKDFNIQLEVSKIANIHYFEFTNRYHTPNGEHNFCELLYVDRGSIIVRSENYCGVLNDNQLIIHRPNEIHSLECDETVAPNVIIIGFECMSDELEPFSKNPMTLSQDEKRMLSEIMKEGMSVYAPPYDLPNTLEMKKREDYPFGADQLIKLRLETLLISLVRDNKKSQQASENTTDELTEIENIHQYICEHYTEKILLDNICFIFGTNKTTLCSSFKKRYNATILNYINNLRIKDAKALLRKNELSVTQISENLGFNSIHYFCRVFKKTTGQSPKEYIKTIRSKLEL